MEKLTSNQVVTIKNKFTDKSGSQEWTFRPQSQNFKAIFPDLPQSTMEVQLDKKSTSFRFNQSEEAVMMFIRLADLLAAVNNEGTGGINSLII